MTAEPRVKFLRGFPRIGDYVAAAVPAGPAGPASGAYHAVLAADTLLPDGHGQALAQQEVGCWQCCTLAPWCLPACLLGCSALGNAQQFDASSNSSRRA